jgi:hypothetical protein
MSYEPEPYDRDTGAAADKVSVPAILLIVTGILNLLGSLGYFFVAFVFFSMPADQLEQAMQQQNPEQRKALEEQGIGPEQLRNIYVVGGGISGVVGLVSALITLFGGVRMRSLHGYGLAVFASILALVPCISPVGCCLVGQIAGIWALIVLASPEVRSAFR